MHAYRELFYVLEGEYEFTFERDGALEAIGGGAGTVVAVPPNAPHTFRNASGGASRLLFVHQPAALEEFFEEFGVPVERVGGAPHDQPPPDLAAMAGALERNGVQIAAEPVA